MSLMPIHDPTLRALVFGIPQAPPASGENPNPTTGTYRTTGEYAAAPGGFLANPPSISATSPAARMALAVLLGGLIAYVVLRVLK
jgi:hypothetical protein